MSANRVRAPLSMLALLRTISEIIGRPPTKAQARFAVPTATMSRSMLVLRFQGSITSTALAERIDSKLPMMKNMNVHFSAFGSRPPVNAEKSGVVM